MARVILAAAGEGSRWGNAHGVPKQFVKVEGDEPVLYRAARLFRSAGAEVIVTGPNDDRWRTPHSELFVSTPGIGLYQPRALWNPGGRTIQAYGDVFYTEEAVQKIMGHLTPTWHLFGRLGRSRLTGTPWAEIFAHSYWPEHHDLEQWMIDSVAAEQAAGRIPRAIIYEMYKVWKGALYPFSWSTPDLGDFTEINDWTDDFDTPDRYEAYLRRRQRAWK